ncbi:MAG: hypothetical protein J6T88_00865 [Bacteroidales bacterium]|nr:hypothetical protein [Bacteroidales bacterium]
MLLFTMSFLFVIAQGKLAGGFPHVLCVKNYPNWGKGYLTVTNDGGIFLHNGDMYMPYSVAYDLVGTPIFSGYIIIEVDGKSAYGWTPSQFYNAIDGRTDTIRLKLKKQENGKIVEFETAIRPRYELPEELKMFYNFEDAKYLCSIGLTRKMTYKKTSVTYEERSDEDYDFFNAVKYDYAINSDDPLLDKELLDVFIKANLPYSCVRDEANPDIIFAISRDVNENIITTYVPPSERTIYTGSTTTAKYNFYTHNYDNYETKQNYKTVYEGGYVQETKTVDVFLQIAALDAKKINDPSQKSAPIIWQATTKRHAVNKNFDPSAELKAFAGWTTFPGDRTHGLKIYPWLDNGRKIEYAPLGVVASASNKRIIEEVVKGSLAEKIGLKAGDKFIKADWNNHSSPGYKYFKKSTRKEAWNSRTFNSINHPTILEILRNGQKLKYTIEPQLIKFFVSRWE